MLRPASPRRHAPAPTRRGTELVCGLWSVALYDSFFTCCFKASSHHPNSRDGQGSRVRRGSTWASTFAERVNDIGHEDGRVRTTGTALTSTTRCRATQPLSDSEFHWLWPEREGGSSPRWRWHPLIRTCAGATVPTSSNGVAAHTGACDSAARSYQNGQRAGMRRQCVLSGRGEAR